MLLELERPREALAAYEASLERSPNRLNSLYGAGRAAELANDKKKAEAYYGKLIEVTAQADTNRPHIQHARTFLRTL